MTEIILVRYKLPEIEKDCMASVVEYTDVPYSLRVFDNASENHNLGKLWNRLIGESEAEYICLLNTDTIVEQDWLKKLLEVFEKEEGVGAVGPSTNGARNAQKTKEKFKRYEVSDFIQDFPGWCLSGFCIVFPKRAWKQVGGFAEDFGFYGQEVVFLDKFTKAGLKQMWRKDVFIHHDHSSSAKAAQKRGEMNELEERKKGNLKIQEIRKKNEN